MFLTELIHGLLGLVAPQRPNRETAWIMCKELPAYGHTNKSVAAKYENIFPFNIHALSSP
jgi:hypothetical protein